MAKTNNPIINIIIPPKKPDQRPAENQEKAKPWSNKVFPIKSTITVLIME